jgi:glutamate synthase domain-containing protein 1
MNYKECLQALKHRGEDSTGYALYGDTEGKNFIMRVKVGENVGEEVHQLLRMCLFMMREKKS